MSNAVQIVTDDLKAQIYRLEGLRSATPAAMARFLTRSITKIQRQAKNNAPVLHGALRRNINWKVESDASAVITVGVKYGRIQEFGGVTKPHDIYAKPGKALVFPWAKWNNAFSIGRGSKSRVFSMKNYSASAALAGVSMKTGRRGKGKAVSGVAALAHVHHPGSRIKGQHYTRDAFESLRPQIEADAAKLIAAQAGGK